jgi:diacylglycerol kinase family enzyme
MRRRLVALVALALGLATLVLAVVVVVEGLPTGLVVVACLALVAGVAWQGIVRGGRARTAAFAFATVALLAALILVLASGRLLTDLALVAGVLATLALARTAFAVHEDLPRADPPAQAVLFFNPSSGGGKAERFHLAEEARARGIEPVGLERGDDLERLVRNAVERGADAVAMAGGDGSQAIVAAIAAEYGIPYACVPAGTRNHFALDLGVDRDDVVGALDALVDGGERRVDLAEVNGRVFVNNVSLGVYADAVQQPGYREAKLRTLLDAIPEAEGPAAVLVSNNRYRLGRAVASGTRPCIDAGVLGIAVLDSEEPAGRRPWRGWTAPTFELPADHPVKAGIDGEAAELEPPLRFASRPGVLRVRIARRHPGASPSARLPDTGWAAVRALAAVAFKANANNRERSSDGPG